MDVVVALHVAAALLLIVAGVAKIVRPVPTTDLLASVGLPEVPAAVVVIGVVESVVGVLALAGRGAAVGRGDRCCSTSDSWRWFGERSSLVPQPVAVSVGSTRRHRGFM